MKILDITLQNFRIFSNTKIEFSTDPIRNVTIVLGNNGSGKTTLAQAFRWCLYNKINFNDQCVLSHKAFEKIPVGGKADVNVTVRLLYKNKIYTFSHTRTFRKLREITPSLSIGQCVTSDGYPEKMEATYMDDMGKTQLIEPRSLAALREEIIPQKLANYIFFDGERIESMSKGILNSESNTEFKTAVNNMLGLETWRNAIEHLGSKNSSSRNSVWKKFHNEYLKLAGPKAQKINQKIEELNEEIEQCRAEIQKIQLELDRCASQIQINQRVITENKDSAEIQEEMHKLLKSAKRDDQTAESLRLDLVRRFREKILNFSSQDLVVEALQQLKGAKLNDKFVPHVNAETINAILDKGVCICGTEIKEGSKEYQTLLELRKFVPPESIGSVIHSFANEIEAAYTSNSPETLIEDLFNYRDKIESYLDESTRKKRDAENLKRGLAGGNFGEKVQFARLNITKLEERREYLNRQIGQLQNKIKNNNSEIVDLRNQMQKKARTAHSAEIFSLCESYVDLFSNFLQDEYRKNEKSIRQRLQDEMQSIFQRLNGPSMKLEIDEHYRTYSRVTDYSKTELSEAESATASISFIGGILALGRKLVSEKDELEELIEPVPLVMDAPFSAFDKTKIEAICNVIPGITLQVIIFIKDTDGDIALHYFAERIGKKFKITRNEEFISSITEDL